MVAIKIRHLIDQAIGFPETGHVNFSALQSLLIFMAEKLGITEDTLNYDEIENEKVLGQLSKPRLIAGFNPESENNGNGESNEAENPSLTQSLKEDQSVGENQKQQEELEKETGKLDTKQATNIEKKEQEFINEVEETPRISDITELSAEKLKEHLSHIEMANTPDFASGISIMKDQLEFAIEQLLLVTYILLSEKADSQQMQKLYSLAQALNEMKKENIFIKGVNRLEMPSVPSLNWVSSKLKLEDSNLVTNEFTISSQDIMEDHLCYSPSKLLDQLMTLKSEFCQLTNKVNELSAYLLKHDSQHLLAQIQDIEKQIQNIKLVNVDLKENLSRFELRISSNQNNVEILKRNQEGILQTMVDKTNFEIQLANKVDYNQLQRKASLDQVMELQSRMDKKFSDLVKRFNESDKKFADIVENLRITLGPTAMDEVLAKFKETISRDMQQLNELLRNYIAATDDDCAAAGARVKMLQNLACLSCDTDCVMPLKEKAKVAKLPSAYTSSILSPLITYELSSIRKSGIMGYYRKDEFPHSPNAWLAQQSPRALTSSKQCAPRHAGGSHTTNSAKERILKTKLIQKY